MSSNKKSNNIPIVATIAVAAAATVLAVAAIIIILVSKGGSNNGENSSQVSSVVKDTSYLTQEYRDECGYAAHDLLNSSHEILRLFVTEGLFHDDEPYGNLPEDGYYTVNSTDYTTLDQIEELVRSVYTDEAADQIMTNVDGNGLVVYANRKQLVKVETSGTAEATADSTTQYDTIEVLGISADFKPQEAKSWSSCAITIDYIEEGKCGLTVYLDGAEQAEGTVEADGVSVLKMTMVKQDSGWRLAEFVTRAEQ